MNHFLKLSLFVLCGFATIDAMNTKSDDTNPISNLTPQDDEDDEKKDRSSFCRLAEPPAEFFALRSENNQPQVPEVIQNQPAQNVYPPLPKTYFSQLNNDLIETALLNCPKEINGVIEALKFTKYDFASPIRPRKLLLVGPPGTGKTTYAHIIAGAAGMPCFTFKASMIADQYKNSGDKNLEAMFSGIIALNIPCVVFIDELQVLIKKDMQHLNNDNSMLTTLWSLLDECEKYPILFIGAFNYVENVPPQLLERQDEVIKIDLPNKVQREKALRYLARSYEKTVSNIYFDLLSFSDLARKTDGCSYRKLSKMMAKSVRLAINRDSKMIMVKIGDCLDAKDEMRDWEQKIQDPYVNSWQYSFLKNAPIVAQYGFPIASMAISLYFGLRQEARADLAMPRFV